MRQNRQKGLATAKPDFDRIMGARQRSAKRQDEGQRTVEMVMGLRLLKEPLPASMLALERLRVYAREGYAYRGEGTAEDFERLWQKAIAEGIQVKQQ